MTFQNHGLHPAWALRNNDTSTDTTNALHLIGTRGCLFCRESLLRHSMGVGGLRKSCYKLCGYMQGNIHADSSETAQLNPFSFSGLSSFALHGLCRQRLLIHLRMTGRFVPLKSLLVLVHLLSDPSSDISAHSYANCSSSWNSFGNPFSIGPCNVPSHSTLNMSVW
jgi:hypothetical protein